MTLAELQAFVHETFAHHPQNVITAAQALTPDMEGLVMYDEPLLGIGDAHDPLFAKLQQEDVIGPHFLLPPEWLPSAHSVISLFFPLSSRVKAANAQDFTRTATEWYQARIEGHAFIAAFCNQLAAHLCAQGHEALVPCHDPRFFAVTGSWPLSGAVATPKRYTSNWSERHVGFVCGLGSFGLTHGLLTAKGAAGRMGSVVTSLTLPPTMRESDDPFYHCTLCGLCAHHCPAGALDLSRGIIDGKDLSACSAYLGTTKLPASPHYGCGKCQVAVPCENGFPGRG